MPSTDKALTSTEPAGRTPAGTGDRDDNATGGTGDGTVRLRLSSARPLTQDLITELNAVCDRVEDTGGAEVAVFELTGAVSGEPAPVQWPGGVNIHLVSRWEKAIRRVERLCAPTVAIVEGECSGPALELLLATDYRIGTPRTRLSLGQQAGVLWPGMALHRLEQQVGLARVRRLALFNMAIEAREALPLGLLDEVAEAPHEVLATLLERVGQLTGAEIAVRRRLLLEAATTPHEDALGVHLAACDRALRRQAPSDAQHASVP